MAFWKFDKHGAVLKYDAWIPNLNNWIEASTGAQISNSQFRTQSIQQICAVTQTRCTGPNTQWESIDECASVLSQKAYGNYDEAWGDNIVCRSIHLVLTQVRPDVSSRLVFRLSAFWWQTADTDRSNRFIVLTWGLQAVGNAWMSHILLTTLMMKASMVIRLERLSCVIHRDL